MPSSLGVIKSLLACSFAFSFAQAFSQINPIQQEALLLQKALEKHHYSPRILDDNLSKEILSGFLESLDPHHLYFTAVDFRDFLVFQNALDDELRGNGWKFFPNVAKVYRDRLLAAENICRKIASQPLDFSSDERLVVTESENNYAKNDDELIGRWTRWLKYQTLWQLVNLFDEENPSGGTEEMILNRESEIRNKVLKVELRKIKKILEHPQEFENYLKTQYFNSITACYDPHTNYLSKTELQNFESALAVEGLSFGIDLEENEFGDIEILRLVPGGPAWKSNELHKGDVLLKLKWVGKEDYDLTGADLNEVEAILLASNNDLLEFTVRSPVGTIKTVKLKKEKIREDENVVKSFIINGEIKVGYISLPGFYSDWDNTTGQGCANDVAKEIVKLKKENIDGLILDVRYNGGGSLLEGMNLVGIFIDEGPLLMMQGRDGKLNILKDMNRGTVYDGPLVVMVNGQSASASEIFASTLQDYNRAIIIGSTTYGKSTGQSIIPLDPNQIAVNSKKSPYGFVKVTKDKLFRVTGHTAQLQGVKPDVYLPDIYEVFNFREITLPNAMPNDSINKKILYAKLPLLPLTLLNEKVQARVNEHDGFKRILELRKNSHMASVKLLKEIPLNISFFQNLNKEINFWDGLHQSTESFKSSRFNVENPPFNSVLIEVDPYGKEVNATILQNLQSDIYIEQSFLVLNDLLKIVKKP